MTGAIHPKTRIGSVHIVVSNLQRSLEFYEHTLNLVVNQAQTGTASLGAGGHEHLLYLTELPGSQLPPNYTGLYHFALLVPTRKDLAWAYRTLIDSGTAIQGCSDHLVSEAVYLNDPDGNGIELYYDRPREHWLDENGRIRMATYPLAIDGLLAELDSGHENGDALHHDTTVGHVHLHVADLGTAEEFYCGVLGFELVLRYGTGAAFVSAGGYHHHIGLNTWAGVGAHPPPSGSCGLRWYTVSLPHRRALSDVAARIRASGNQLEERKEELFTRDPSGNGVMFEISTDSSETTIGNG